jgi:MFS family permease
MHHIDFHGHCSHEWNPKIIQYYIYKFLRQIGVTLLTLFIPVFLFTEVGYSLFQISIFFTINQLYFVLFGAFSGKIIEKIGLKHALALHIPGFILFTYMVQFLSSNFMSDIWYILLILAVRSIPAASMVAADTLFIAKNIVHNKKSMGSSLSKVKSIMILATILTPFIGGVVTNIYGFQVLFIVAIVILFLSVIPLIITKDQYFKVNTPPQKIIDYTIKHLPKNFVLAEMGKWIPYSLIWLMWPIFIYIIVEDVYKVGAVISLSGILALLVSGYIGRRVDKKSSKGLLRKSINFSALIYFLRVVFPDPIIIMITDAANKIIEPLVSIPYQKYYFDFIRSNKNMIRVSVAGNLVLQAMFTIGFVIFSIYFGVLELMNIAVGYVQFLILFSLMGVLVIFMNKISNVGKGIK